MSDANVKALLTQLEATLLKPTNKTLPISSFQSLLKFNSKSIDDPKDAYCVKDRLESHLFTLRRNRFFDRANALDLLQQELLRNHETDSNTAILSLLIELSGEGDWNELSSETHKRLENVALNPETAKSLVYPKGNVVFHSDSKFVGPHSGDLRPLYFTREEIERPLDDSGLRLEDESLVFHEPEISGKLNPSGGVDPTLFGAISHRPNVSNTEPRLTLPPFDQNYRWKYMREADNTPEFDQDKYSRLSDPPLPGKDSGHGLPDLSNLMGIGKGNVSEQKSSRFVPEQQIKFAKQWEQTKQSWKRVDMSDPKIKSGSVRSAQQKDGHPPLPTSKRQSRNSSGSGSSGSSSNSRDGRWMDRNMLTEDTDLYRRYLEHPGSSVPCVSQADLVECVLNVLQGIPSKYFTFNERGQQFSPVKCRVQSLSTTTTLNTMNRFSVIGTQFRRIETLSEYLIENPDEAGLVAQAFGEAVRDYLNFFCASIIALPDCIAARKKNHKQTPISEFASILPGLEQSLSSTEAQGSLPHSSTLLDVQFHIRKISAHLRWLSQLCQTSDTKLSTFPTGTSLLTYLYEFEHCSDPMTIPLLRYLFSKTFEVYLCQLNAWIYEGTLQIECSEIFTNKPGIEDQVQIYENFLAPRAQFHEVAHIKVETPSFLEDSAIDIAMCGQSLHLLKSCNTDYYNCCKVVDHVNSPSRLCFLDANLKEIKTGIRALADYQMASLQVLKQKKTLHEERLTHQKEQEREEKATALSLEYQQKLENEIAKKAQIQEQKRKRFQEVLQDLAERHERETLEQRKRKEEQMQYRVLQQRKAEEIAAKKREMILSYEQKTQEVDQVHKRLDWQIKREELRLTRTEFLTNERLNVDGQYRAAVEDTNFVPQSELPKPRKLEHTVQALGDDQHPETGTSQPGEFDQKSDDPMEIEELNHANLMEHTDQTERMEIDEPKAPSEADTEIVSFLDFYDPSDYEEESTKPNVSQTEQDLQNEQDEDLPDLEPADLPDLEFAKHQNEEKVAYGSDVSHSGSNSNKKEQESDPHEVYDGVGFFVAPIPDVPELPSIGLVTERDNKFHINPRVFVEPAQPIVSLSIAVNKCIVSSITSQFETVNRAALNFLEWEYNLRGLFAAFRRYYMMEGDDFIGIFCRYLCKSIKTKPKPLNPINLNAQLLQAAQQCGCDSDPFFAPLVVENWTPESNFPRVDGINYFDGIRLEYKLEWPMTLIFSKSALDTYNQIFLFLLKLNRVSSELHELWRSDGFSFRKRSLQLRALQLFRFEAQHLIDNLQGYFMSQVQNTTDYFNECLDKAKSIHDVIQRHRGFLKKCLHVCFLDGKRLQDSRQRIAVMFTSILQFKAQVQNIDFSYAIPDRKYRSICRTMTQFRDNAMTLYRVVKGQAEVQVSLTHRTAQLYLRLDMNDYYQRRLVGYGRK